WNSSDLEWSPESMGHTPALESETTPRGGWIGQLASPAAPPPPAPHAAEGEGHSGHVSIRPFTLGLGALLFFFGVPFYPSMGGLAMMGLGGLVAVYTFFGWAKDDLVGRFSVPDQGHERWPFSAVPKVKLGMWIFLSSEVILFGSFIGAYIFIIESVPGFPLGTSIHDIPVGTFNTLVLVSSGFTMAMAVMSIKKGNQRGLLGWLAVSFVLGSTFMGIKISEWSNLAGTGFSLASTTPLNQLAASAYYFLVGLHGAHVTAGLLVMVILIKKTVSGSYTKDNYAAIENFALYWAFVDLVWCFLFPLFYLL
ncbi:MAG TPA: cytochrome c oxidase subunit 3, partial [Nitrososphaerales archaeon]|nr:cytochrome c oxidase subunit 3 [Nitrososphaerales archaeon]